MTAQEIEAYSADLNQDGNWKQWILDLDRRRVAPFYITQELHAMRAGTHAHFETSPLIRHFLKLSQEEYPGFCYLYADHRIVIANGEQETLVGYWQA